MTSQPRPANRILSALPQEEFERLRPKLREVNFKAGKIIYDAEEPINDVYFINSGIVSWLATLEDGNTVEAGVIGPEGIAGMAVLIIWLSGRADGRPRKLSSGTVTQPGPGWEEAMFSDGTYFYGRAYGVNHTLIDPDAMAGIAQSGYAPAEGGGD